MKRIIEHLDMIRIVAHLDMDAFFASVEERNTPAFKGKPIVVGAEPKGGYGRGVVSTANYKAREYGIHSAMPITRAWAASEKAKREGKPEAIFVPPDFYEYEKSSRAVLGIIEKHSDLVEQASIDEFFFDLSSANTFNEAEKVSKRIKEEIREKERVTCSIGLAQNKLIAKIAAGMKKPDGLFIVPACRQAGDKGCELFLDPLPIRELPGIGPKTATLLHKKNIFLIKDLKKLSEEELHQMLGKWGLEIYEKARGIDDAPIVRDKEVKSIGEQNTFEKDTFDIIFISSELETYAMRVFDRFKASSFSKFKTISISVRFSDFQTFTAAKSFKIPLGRRDAKKLRLEVLKLLLPFLDRRKNPNLKRIRLIGIRIENLIA